jgi:hypothetical protein
MIVLVGHGPSIVGKQLGPWLDEQTVIRLKAAEIPDAADWGTRTDYVCASNPQFLRKRIVRKLPPIDAEYWFLPEQPIRDLPPGTRQAGKHWMAYWRKYVPANSKTPKPSTGLRAVFCAVEFLAPAEIGLVGFDRILHPEVKTTKWFHPVGKHVYAHEAEAEQRALFDLGVKITEIRCPPSSTLTP